MYLEKFECVSLTLAVVALILLVVAIIYIHKAGKRAEYAEGVNLLR